MNLEASIKKKYLEQILGGGKEKEYREIESITLDCMAYKKGSGENCPGWTRCSLVDNSNEPPNFPNCKFEFVVEEVRGETEIVENHIREEYSDVPWTGAPIAVLELDLEE